MAVSPACRMTDGRETEYNRRRPLRLKLARRIPRMNYRSAYGLAAKLQAVKFRAYCALNLHTKLIICRWENIKFASGKILIFPPANGAFADCKFYICHLSGKKFAVDQRDTCRWQTFHLPTANKKFAIGKCAAGHRQNSCPINGKLKFCHRQIWCVPDCL